MLGEFKLDRRRFINAAAMSIAATGVGVIASVDAPSSEARPVYAKANNRSGNSFGPLKQIDAGVLNVAYAEAGPVNGRVVILLHGWSYDIYTYVDVASILASQGYRVLVPFVRGYGSTRFLSSSTLRNGQPSAIATDMIAFMDALRIDKGILGGCDWGARTANIMAALWPERCKAMVSVSGLSDRQPGGRQNALTAKCGTSVVVSVLFCD